MDATDVLETLEITDWAGPFEPGLRARAADALESGRVLVMPALPFTLTPRETPFLSQDASDASRKNISLDPATSRIKGTAFTGDEADRLSAMLNRYAEAATGLLTGLIPGYATGLERARTSFRPVEVQGRALSQRRDDALLHVDAFPTRPMQGRRILRVFSNIAPDGAGRDWLVGEKFEPFAARYLSGLRRRPPGEALALALLRLTRGKRSRYDEIMLSLHDAVKLDPEYQASAPRAAVTFMPGTTWITYTDQVLHAALAGSNSQEQTFHLPVSSMTHPERTPLRVLERLSGQTLV
jgi:hypothetical protein